jgi:hypothetical protein
MDTWEQLEAARVKQNAAWRKFERVMDETPNEARDEEGWTPELLAAAQRQLNALGEWLTWAKSDHTRSVQVIREALRQHEEGP